MNRLVTWFICLSLLVAGLIGTTLSLPLQAPSLILLGLTGMLSAVTIYRTRYNLRLLIPALVAIAYFMARAWFSPVEDLALEDLFLIFAASILYFVASAVDNRVGMRIAMAMTVLVLLILHLGSAVMQVSGDSGYSLLNQFVIGLRPEGNTVTGMYGYRGSFANFSVVAGMLALCLGVWGRFNKLFRISLVCLGGIAFTGVIFAQSRSAMLSLIAAGVVLLVMLWLSVAGQNANLRKKVRGVVVVIGCLSLVFGIVGSILIFQSRAQETVMGADVIFDSGVRLAYWPMAVEQFIDHPLIGAGSRSYSYECFQYWNPNLDKQEANPEFVHNEYLQILADYGIVGFFFAISLLILHFVLGVRRVRVLSLKIQESGFNEGSNAMALAIAGIVGIVAMCVHIIFDFRTHLLANLLLLICCLVWVLPASHSHASKKKSSSKWSVWITTLCLLSLSITAIYIGALQLRGGLPLLKNRMATETGTWVPKAVNRSVWIPNLEASIQLAPSYRRHLKLGALYRLNADDLIGEERIVALKKSVTQYEQAALRHPYEPVSQINLATLHTRLGNYEQAEICFNRARHLGASREYWLKIYLQQVNMQRVWARSLWKRKEMTKAKEHYAYALKLLDEASKGGEWEQMYLIVIIEYARLLDDLGDFTGADAIYEKAEQDLPPYVISSLDKNIRREIGEHYLKKAKFLWHRRQTKEAYMALEKAQKNFHIHSILLKGKQDKQWEKGNNEVKQIIKFFKTTGIDQS